MCEPTTIALAATAIIAAGTAVHGHETQRRATNTMIDQEEEARRMRVADAQAQQAQAIQVAQEQQSERAMQLQRELSFLEASSAEYGGGNSQDRLATLATAAGARDMATIATNRDQELTQLSRANEADIVNSRNRIASIRSNGPSRAGTLLQIGAAATDAYGGYKKRSDPKYGRPTG